MLPASFWYLFLLVVPLALVVVYSLGERGTLGGYTPAFTLDHSAIVFARPEPFLTSLWM